jgi:hypothetical protein
VGEGNKIINKLKKLNNRGMKGMGDTCTEKNF